MVVREIANQTKPNNSTEIDTVPSSSNKNYINEIIINSKRNDTTIVVRDENKRKVKRLLLSEWNKKKEYYEELYGHLPEDSKRLVNVTSLKVDIDNNSQAKVTMDDGRVEMYNLNDEK